VRPVAWLIRATIPGQPPSARSSVWYLARGMLAHTRFVLRRDDALPLLDEARTIAEAHQAPRILGQVNEARSALWRVTLAGAQWRPTAAPERFGTCRASGVHLASWLLPDDQRQKPRDRQLFSWRPSHGR
jgi:hypothetical protein